MPKVFSARIGSARRASPVKRPVVSKQKTVDAGAGAEAVTPAALFSFDSPSSSSTFCTASGSCASAAATGYAKSGTKASLAAVGSAALPANAVLNQAVPPANPEFDDRYEKVGLRLAKLARVERWHEPVGHKIEQASRATQQPATEPPAFGMQSHVEKMSEAKDHPAGDPAQEESFLTLLDTALEKISPKSASDMEDLAENPARRNDIQGDVHAGVRQQREVSEKELADAAKRPPPLGLVEAPAQDVPGLPHRGDPVSVNAKDTLPLPKSEDEASFADDKQEAEDAVTESGLSEEELAASNEPMFEKILTERDQVLNACANDAAAYRQDETGFLKHAGDEATAEENKTRSAMRHGSSAVHSLVRSQQEQMARNNEAERFRIASGMQLVYVGAKMIVDVNLASLEPFVERTFTTSFNVLFDVLQQTVHEDMDKWEEKRHKGLWGKALWWKDLARGTAHLKQAKRIYNNARNGFEKSMRIVFHRIAKYVDDTLAACKEAITKGNARLDELVANERDAKLKEFAAATASRIKGDFSGLQQSVDEKKNDLANSLANRYKNSRATVDKWIAADKEKHRGWAKRLWDWAHEIYEIVVNFKNKLLNVLRRGVEIIMSIIRHPIRFLENLVAAVKQGLQQFIAHIGDHLREAAFSWLFGEIPSSQIHMPKDFSPASIFGLAMEVLNFTPEAIRARAAHILGEHSVEVLEGMMTLVEKLFREGPAALWDELQSMLGGVVETIVDGVRDWVLAQVIKRGIEQLALMLTPVGAFIEACIAIYNLIVFFVDHAEQIADMLNGILDSVEDMVEGRIDAAANRVEGAMTRALAFILGFLTSLIGVPSPAAAIQRIINNLRDTVGRAIDWLLEKFKKLAMKAGFAVKSVAGKVARLIFPKETFEVEGATHTIEAVPSGETYPIVVHSDGVDMATLIQEAKDNRIKGATALERAYTAYQKIHIKEVSLKDKKEREAKSAEIEKEGQKKIAAFEDVAELIKQIFPKIPSLAKRQAKTLVTYGQEKTIQVGSAAKKKNVIVGGTMMVAHPLAYDSLGKGSDTETDIPPIMTDTSWPAGRRGLYKRGHLLNQLLGGPGKETRNITPLTSSANGLHNTRVESDIKKLMNASRGEMMHYEVHVNYPASPRQPTGKADSVEGQFSISLSTRWWELEADGKGYEKKAGGKAGGETIPNVSPYP